MIIFGLFLLAHAYALNLAPKQFLTEQAPGCVADVSTGQLLLRLRIFLVPDHQSSKFSR